MCPRPDQPAPRSAWNLPRDRRLQGWARSPEGSGLGRERAKPRIPRRPARRSEKGQSFVAPSSELEPGAACGTRALGAPVASSPPSTSALRRLSAGGGCLFWPGRALRVQPPTRAGRAGFPGASGPKLSGRRQGVPNPEFPEPPEKESDEAFTLSLNKAQHGCGLGRE